MLIKALFSLMQCSPWAKRTIWRNWYQYIAGYKNADWGFMNYGYAPRDGEPRPVELSAEDEPHRFAIQLYHRVATAFPIAGAKVLEVGSGRGGGASYVARYLKPASVTGVDYSKKAVAFCSARHRVPSLTFVHGDAEALPFDNDAFDAVINVESSHCYGSMSAFLGEVRRVLKPGGSFSLADLRGAEDRQRLHEQMLASGLEVVEHEEITPQVVEALRADSARKLALIEKSIGKWLLSTIAQFAGIEGSETYENFRTGKYVYLRYLMRKTN